MTLESLLADYRTTSAAIAQEEEMRAQIMKSEAYMNMQMRMESLQKTMDAMLESVPDSREENDMDKKALIEYMQANGLRKAGEFSAKMRAKNEVNTRTVMHVLEGDIDNFFLLATIKQKDWKDFCDANPQYKKEKSKCIEKVGETIVDIIPVES